MKHLKNFKLFESIYNNEKISAEEYRISIGRGFVNFSDKYFETLKKTFTGLIFTKISNPLNKISFDSFNDSQKDIHIKFYIGKDRIIIYQINDSWFVLSHAIAIPSAMKNRWGVMYEYYKCDEVEGLIEIIKEIKKDKILPESVVNESVYNNEKISETEYNSILRFDAIDFESGDAKFLQKLLPNHKIEIRNTIGSPSVFPEGKQIYRIRIDLLYMKRSLHDERIIVTQLKDRWFIASALYNGKYFYYKCDEVEGLLIKLKEIIQDYKKYEE